jgi:hypothetical protein
VMGDEKKCGRRRGVMGDEKEWKEWWETKRSDGKMKKSDGRRKGWNNEK